MSLRIKKEKMKLVKEILRRDYELTYLLAGDLLDADAARVKKEISDLLEKKGGKVVKENDWGRKHLAYKVREAGKSYEEAVYVHLIIDLAVDKVQAFDKELILNRDIIRHLLVVAEDSAAAREAAAE